MSETTSQLVIITLLHALITAAHKLMQNFMVFIIQRDLRKFQRIDFTE